MDNASHQAGFHSQLTCSHNQVYAVNLVSPDLRQEEMIARACNALERLEKVSTDIFSKITQKITERNSELESISKRIDAAQVEIKH